MKRTIIIPNCERTFTGSPREVNNKMKIHKRNCDKCKDFIDASSVPFNSSLNGRGGYYDTRHGGVAMRKLEVTAVC